MLKLNVNVLLLEIEMDSEFSEPNKTPTGVKLVCSSRFHPERCVICQKSDVKEGSKEGFLNLKRAADEKHDVVVKKRIQTLEEDNKPFLRHRECVKRYTYKAPNDQSYVEESESVVDA